MVIHALACLAVLVVIAALAGLSINYGMMTHSRVPRSDDGVTMGVTFLLLLLADPTPSPSGIKFTRAQSRAWAMSAAVSIAVEWFITNPSILLLEHLFLSVVRSRYVTLMAARDRRLQAKAKENTVGLSQYEYEFEYKLDGTQYRPGDSSDDEGLMYDY